MQDDERPTEGLVAFHSMRPIDLRTQDLPPEAQDPELERALTALGFERVAAWQGAELVELPLGARAVGLPHVTSLSETGLVSERLTSPRGTHWIHARNIQIAWTRPGGTHGIDQSVETSGIALRAIALGADGTMVRVVRPTEELVVTRDQARQAMLAHLQDPLSRALLSVVAHADTVDPQVDLPAIGVYRSSVPPDADAAQLVSALEARCRDLPLHEPLVLEAGDFLRVDVRLAAALGAFQAALAAAANRTLLTFVGLGSLAIFLGGSLSAVSPTVVVWATFTAIVSIFWSQRSLPPPVAPGWLALGLALGWRADDLLAAMVLGVLGWLCGVLTHVACMNIAWGGRARVGRQLREPVQVAATHLPMHKS